MNEQKRERLAEADARREHRANAYEEWERRAKADALEISAILLTPAGCAYLYDMNVQTVGQTRRRHEREAVRAIAGFGGQTAALLRYEWAQEHWGHRRMEDRFDQMMEFGHVLGIGGTTYVILHRSPIIVDRYPPSGGTIYAPDLGKEE